jgi:hypothetical protein
MTNPAAGNAGAGFDRRCDQETWASEPSLAEMSWLS